MTWMLPFAIYYHIIIINGTDSVTLNYNNEHHVMKRLARLEKKCHINVNIAINHDI